ncbi:hypothetical protein C8Q75DRAFT_736537 [Abortiporus biennis]|nr:hypothetical protein C8Q75DRAFT_736537 [Abortiporus biennis]
MSTSTVSNTHTWRKNANAGTAELARIQENSGAATVQLEADLQQQMVELERLKAELAAAQQAVQQAAEQAANNAVPPAPAPGDIGGELIEKSKGIAGDGPEHDAYYASMFCMIHSLVGPATGLDPSLKMKDQSSKSVRIAKKKMLNMFPELAKFKHLWLHKLLPAGTKNNHKVGRNEDREDDPNMGENGSDNDADIEGGN